MGEFLFFWLSRIGAAILEWKVLASADGGFRLSVVLAGVVIAMCLIALTLYA